jgi:hypothetical protein
VRGAGKLLSNCLHQRLWVATAQHQVVSDAESGGQLCKAVKV